MKDSIIGLRELRENTEDYINQINKGKSFMVVRKSKPVFKLTPVDNLNGEGAWETIVDFTEFNKSGISAKDLLKRLKNINGQDR